MDKRPSHFISSNKRMTRPERVIFFDTETCTVPISPVEKQHVLRLGWACYWERETSGNSDALVWQFFVTAGEFWDFVEPYLDPKTPLFLVAHNIAFDWRIVGGFDHADSTRWAIHNIYHKDLTTIVKYQTGRGVLCLLDTGNFFPVSLAEIGRIVGIEKQEIDFDACGPLELSVYCKNDVAILVEAWEAWLDFLDEHELGDFKYTIASQAFAAYRHCGMKYPIGIHDDIALCEFEREAYRGGRVECFHVGRLPEGQYYQLDVNGMYCYQMREHDYPRLLRAQHETLSLRRLRALLHKCCVIAQVVVKTEYPVFPLRADGINIYPIGTIKTVLTTPELLFALDHCDIREIGQVAIYARAPIFRDYAKYFAELKEYYQKQGNEPFRAIAKAFGNSLYGKMGQRDMELSFDFELPPAGPQESLYYDYRVKRWYRIYRIGNKTVFEKSGGESFNSFPAIPAHVTAYARMYLWSLITQAGRENCYYCSTDSLIVNQEGYDRLQSRLDPTELGYLKVERMGHELEIWSPGDYQIGDKIRSKGIKKDARQLEPNVFEQEQFLGLRGAIRRKDPDLVTVKRIRKSLRRQIRTGEIQRDGRVVPFRFPL